jgi:hypothetical protein
VTNNLAFVRCIVFYLFPIENNRQLATG